MHSHVSQTVAPRNKFTKLALTFVYWEYFDEATQRSVNHAHTHTHTHTHAHAHAHTHTNVNNYSVFCIFTTSYETVYSK